MFQGRRRVRPQSYLMIYALVALVIVVAHLPLLQLPYYWDEAGQFNPAATDLYQIGAWISHSATPNVHPPGVMAWLAIVWHAFGYSIVITRIAMLLLASFGVTMTFEFAVRYRVNGGTWLLLPDIQSNANQAIAAIKPNTAICTKSGCSSITALLRVPNPHKKWVPHP